MSEQHSTNRHQRFLNLQLSLPTENIGAVMIIYLRYV